MSYNEIIKDSERKGLVNGSIKDILERVKEVNLNFFRESLTEKQKTFLEKLGDQLITFKINIKKSSDVWIKKCDDECEIEKKDEMRKLKDAKKSIEIKLDSTRDFISSHCKTNLIIGAALLTILSCVGFSYSNSLFFSTVDMHMSLAWAAGALLGIVTTGVAFLLGRDYKYKKISIENSEKPDESYVGLTRPFYILFSILPPVVFLIIVILLVYNIGVIYIPVYFIITLLYYGFIFLISYSSFGHHKCKGMIKKEKEYDQKIKNIENLIRNIDNKDCVEYCREGLKKTDESRESVKKSLAIFKDEIQTTYGLCIKKFVELSEKCKSSYIINWRTSRPEEREISPEEKETAIENEYISSKNDFEKTLKGEINEKFINIKKRLEFDSELNAFANEALKLNDSSR